VSYVTLSLKVLISKTKAGESGLHIKADIKKLKKEQYMAIIKVELK
jgi:hypothetical protein